MKQAKPEYQTALFLGEIVALLEKLGAKKVIDATFGEGGHGIVLARRGIRVLAIEWDKEMYDYAKRRIKSAALTAFVVLKRGNFANIEKIAVENGFFGTDAVIFDLGLSMRQLVKRRRGFANIHRLKTDGSRYY